MKKKREPTPTYKALRLRLGIFALALWLAAMSLLTWAVASDMQHQLKAQVRELVARYGEYDVNPGAPADEPLAHRLMTKSTTPYSYIQFEPLLPFVLPHYDSISSNDALWGKWYLYYGFEAAEIFRDGKQYSKVLAKTENTLTFDWYSESSWKAQETAFPSFGYIHPPEELQNILPDFPGMSMGLVLYDALRMTGYFDGSCFIPTTIEAGQVNGRGSRQDAAQLMTADARNAISWYTQYEAGEKAPNAVTIYCVGVTVHQSSLRPVELQGVKYSNIAEACLDGSFKESDSLICTQYMYSGPASQDGQSLYCTVLVRAWPLEYAVRRLWPTYLASALLVLVAVWLLSWRIRRSLTNPLSQLTQWELADVEHAWQEPRLLQETLTDLRQELAETKTKLQQTQTALEYSQSAEQSRKQLISALAHELKTPLAVIHSYSEALQLGIAPERQAHYISVLQEESRRMDAMVLEMLELSRLEAGKVHLATDRVALLLLVKAVEEKLSPLAEEKQIRFAYPLVEEFTLLADEARIEQVLTNLMGNAIKYSPPGATVSVKVFRDGSAARFKIQNPSPPLSNEALEKVWDSFYRADPARSQPGTGLGLALVKTIVELHRGKCAVRNVQLTENDVLPTGVEFSISLPLE